MRDALRLSPWLVGVAALFSALFVATTASANVARHERVEVKQITKGGEVVGVKVKMTLRPEGQHLVRVGIVPEGTPKSDSYDKSRDEGGVWSQAKKGELPHLVKEIKFKDQNPLQQEFTILYKDVPSLKPGASFQIVSAFNQSSSYWHVYGVTGVPGAQPDNYKAPGKAVAKATESKAKSTAASLRKAGQTTSKPKKPARKPSPTRARTTKPRVRARAR